MKHRIQSTRPQQAMRRERDSSVSSAQSEREERSDAGVRSQPIGASARTSAPVPILQLQRAVGNRAVGQLLMRGSRQPLVRRSTSDPAPIQRLFYLNKRAITAFADLTAEEQELVRKAGLEQHVTALAVKPAGYFSFLEASFSDVAELIAKLHAPEPEILWPDEEASTTPGEKQYVRTDKGSLIQIWKAKEDQQQERKKYFCHGFSTGTYKKYGGSPITQQSMKTILGEDFTPVVAGQPTPGDVAVWMQGQSIQHSAIYLGKQIPDRSNIAVTDLSQNKGRDVPKTLYDLTARIPNHQSLVVLRQNKKIGTLADLDILIGIQVGDIISFTFGNDESRFRVDAVPALEHGFHTKNGPQVLYYDTLSFLNDFYKTDTVAYYRRK